MGLDNYDKKWNICFCGGRLYFGAASLLAYATS